MSNEYVNELMKDRYGSDCASILWASDKTELANRSTDQLINITAYSLELYYTYNNNSKRKVTA